MVITVVQTRNRFFRFLDDKTSVLHNEIRYTTKFSPINWGYSSNFVSRAANTAEPSRPTSSLWL